MEKYAPKNWAVMDNGSECDRFATEAEAREALPGFVTPEYPGPYTVQNILDPEPGPVAAIRELLAYNWAGEERDYRENPPDETGRGWHIFERMQEIKAWLDGDGHTEG